MNIMEMIRVVLNIIVSISFLLTIPRLSKANDGVVKNGLIVILALLAIQHFVRACELGLVDAMSSVTVGSLAITLSLLAEALALIWFVWKLYRR